MFGSLLVLLVVIASTCGENPAIQITLTNKGLQYGKHVGAGWIQDMLGRITFPDINGEIKIGSLGCAKYTLSNTTIIKCDFPEPSVEYCGNVTGLSASMLGLNVAVRGQWAVHKWFIADQGSFEMALFNVNLTSVVKVGRDAGGHLTVTSDSCDAQVGDVWIKFSGSGWIFRHISDYMKRQIPNDIKNKLCPYVEDHIVTWNHHLQAMNVSFEVGRALTVEVPLTGLPHVDGSSLTLGLKGEFYSARSPKEPPFVAQPFTLPEQLSYMLSVGFSEFTVNSALFGYFSDGLLQVFINDSMIPPSCPVRLNTSSMGPYIPQLPKLFPGLLMILQVYARETPLFSFQPGTVKLGCLGAVKAFAVQANATLTPLFQLNSDSQFSGKVWIADGKVKGSVTMDNLTLSLASSEIGPFKTDAVENLAKMEMTTVVLSKLNKKLAEGIDLPKKKHAQLTNTILKVEKGFIAISSDAELFSADRSFT